MLLLYACPGLVASSSPGETALWAASACWNTFLFHAWLPSSLDAPDGSFFGALLRLLPPYLVLTGAGILSSHPLLALLLAMGWGALNSFPRLLLHVCIVYCSVCLLPGYWVPLSVLASLVAELIFQGFLEHREGFLPVCYLFGSVLVAVVLFPLVALAVSCSAPTLLAVGSDAEVLDAVRTSMVSATVTTLLAFLFGVPFSYAFARSSFRGKRYVDMLIDLPILVPQTVVGISFMLLLGPRTSAGRLLKEWTGLSVSGTMLGIVLAQTFVSAPFMLRSLISGFSAIDERLEKASRTLGAGPFSTFVRVSLPLASGAMWAGVVLTWARAVSEAGALFILAYHPYTVSILVHERFSRYGIREASPVAVFFLLACLGAFLALRFLQSSGAPLWRSVVAHAGVPSGRSSRRGAKVDLMSAGKGE